MQTLKVGDPLQSDTEGRGGMMREGREGEERIRRTREEGGREREGGRGREGRRGREGGERVRGGEAGSERYGEKRLSVYTCLRRDCLCIPFCGFHKQNLSTFKFFFYSGHCR